MRIGSVFVSHSAQEPDRSVTETLVGLLEAAGLDVWWDKDGLEAGDFFPVEILEAIIRQNFFVFVMSERSISSKWCLRELIRATELGKEVIPLLLEGIPNERSPLVLAGLQYLDIRAGLNEEVRARILRAFGLGHGGAVRESQSDPFAKDGSLIKVLAEQLNYAKGFTDSLNMVLLLENIGKALCETTRAQQVIAGMRSAPNWRNGRIDYDLVGAYLVDTWRGR